MIKFDRSFPRAPRILCLALCFYLVMIVHGKQNLAEPKKKDARHDSKNPAANIPGNQHLKINPEMVLLSGEQKNDLNLVPIKVDVPKEVYVTTPGEKPIVISVSNDKQVLSEDNRMLSSPILLNANLTDAEFFRHLWLRLNSSINRAPASVEGIQKVATVPSSTVKVTPKDSIIAEEKSADLGQMRRNEMKPTLAAIHKDLETANEASTDLRDNFSQTLSSDQLLCVIYKLLTLYKPNFVAETYPTSAQRSKALKYQKKIDRPTTLKPIDNILYNLALSKTLSPLRYKSPWNCHTSPPNEFGHESATYAVHRTADYGPPDARFSVQKTASILDTLPLVKTFNKYSSVPGLPMDRDFFEPFSAPISRLQGGPHSGFEVKNQRHKNGMTKHSESSDHFDGLDNESQVTARKEYTASEDDTNYSIHDEALLEPIHTVSNVSTKQLQHSTLWSGWPEDTYSLYSKLFQQLQDNGRFHSSDALQPSGFDFLHSLTRKQQAQFGGKNHTSSISVADESQNYEKVHPDLHQSYLQLLRSKNNLLDRGLDVNTASKPVSAYYNSGKGKENGLNFSGQNFFSRTVGDKHTAKNSSSNDRPRLKVSSKTRRKEKQPKENKRKKFQIQVKRRSKEEWKKKAHDFDFLDLLSKSMIREAKNFEGRI